MSALFDQDFLAPLGKTELWGAKAADFDGVLHMKTSGETVRGW